MVNVDFWLASVAAAAHLLFEPFDLSNRNISYNENLRLDAKLNLGGIKTFMGT